MNPYQPPGAVVDAGADGVDAEQVASGQKLVIYAFLVYLVSGALQALLSPVAVLLVFPALIMALIGVWRAGSGLGWSVVVKILLLVLMLVPLVNLIVLLVVSARATKALRKADYAVGLLGASNRSAAPRAT